MDSRLELFSLEMTTLAVRCKLDLQHTSTLRTSNDYFLKQVIKISDAPATGSRGKPDKFMHIHHIAATRTVRPGPSVPETEENRMKKTAMTTQVAVDGAPESMEHAGQDMRHGTVFPARHPCAVPP
ncbi:hypothetical protein ACOZ4Y_07630 [Komagataeibacter rhaeticus]|uniref:hypothetical protein n=1 Tax=Komagataeibacter rhaeticus TaxID=215221 RepID=UPI0011B52B33|nr:hypothetical protein [Komagataeibacter rhaeticus]MBL7239785.1 hypothetical protein [Komagataeibacter rhaeticus]GBQ12196.1 hypothetical protein AA16663_1099 [Komagataeibacter rhaeticus DSM 16663]